MATYLGSVSYTLCSVMQSNCLFLLCILMICYTLSLIPSLVPRLISSYRVREARKEPGNIAYWGVQTGPLLPVPESRGCVTF